MTFEQDAISKRVMWTRLISVVEEQAQALLRTAFGSVVREAGDLSAGVYDLSGRMLAQAVTGTPGHVNTMARAARHFLDRFPAESMAPGDVFVTNDPWMGTGHLFDFVVLTPVFKNGGVVGYFASTCHVTDVGGRGFTADARSVFEEGTLIPHMRIRTSAGLNEELLSIIAANSRTPVDVLGDIRSLLSSNDVGARRLLAMMDEFDLQTLEGLAAHIFSETEAATRAAIAAVPDGAYAAEMTIDGYEAPIHLRAALHIVGDQAILDYDGSSGASGFGINAPKCYTDAYSVYGLKCIIAPDVPNNHAGIACFEVRASLGSCVNPERPAPVSARHVIGQMLPDLVFGCLAQALPDRVPAESAGSIWVLALSDAGEGAAFHTMSVGLGGIGALPGADGASTTAFPSGVGGISVEVTEAEAPLIFRQKSFLPGSGGDGRWRGGLAQRIEIAHREGLGFRVSAATWDRLAYPARGRAGGQDGALGAARLGSGPPLRGKVTHEIPKGETLQVDLPGGGGFGPPAARDLAAMELDEAAGYSGSDRGALPEAN